MSNPYLERNREPISREYTCTTLPVTGHIPEFLDGRYLRNGPNPVSEIDPRTYHWFMGDGMVHGVRMRDGRAEWYRNRWIRGRNVTAALGERDRPRNRRAGLDWLGANTNVIGHAGRTLALIEAGAAVWELTEELDTVGPCDFDGTLSGGYTAHPKRDPATGHLHAVSYSFGRGNTVQYSVIGADGRALRTVDITVTGSPLMHDFSLTEKYVILYDLPVTFDVDLAVTATMPRPLRAPARLLLSALIGRVRIPDPLTAMAGRLIGANTTFPYSWKPSYPARIGVMPRERAASENVRWFEIEPCFVFHPLNAYDDGGMIVLDVVRHPKMFDTELRGPNEGPPTLDRWTVDLGAGKVRQERIDDRGQEFPRVDQRLVGQRHRYGYSVAVADSTDFSGRLLKHDLVGGGTTVRDFGKNCEIGEFVFEPSAPDAAEDDGVLMGFVYDRAESRSDLMLLDASTLDTVAAVHLPDRVPAGFHGNWVPAT